MSQPDPEQLAPIAEEAIRHAIRLGLPVYYKRLVRGAFLLRRDHGGKGVLFTSSIPGTDEDPPGTIYVTLASEPVTVWKVPVARIEPGKDPETYPHQVVSAAAQYPVLFTTHEADVWRRRLHSLHTGRVEEADPGEIPKELLEEAKPTRILRLVDIPTDYALLRGNLVVAWYTRITPPGIGEPQGTWITTLKYLEAAGLLPSGEADQEP